MLAAPWDPCNRTLIVAARQGHRPCQPHQNVIERHHADHDIFGAPVSYENRRNVPIYKYLDGWEIPESAATPWHVSQVVQSSAHVSGSVGLAAVWLCSGCCFKRCFIHPRYHKGTGLQDESLIKWNIQFFRSSYHWTSSHPCFSNAGSCSVAPYSSCMQASELCPLLQKCNELELQVSRPWM